MVLVVVWRRKGVFSLFLSFSLFDSLSLQTVSSLLVAWLWRVFSLSLFLFQPRRRICWPGDFFKVKSQESLTIRDIYFGQSHIQRKIISTEGHGHFNKKSDKGTPSELLMRGRDTLLNIHYIQVMHLFFSLSFSHFFNWFPLYFLWKTRGKNLYHHHQMRKCVNGWRKGEKRLPFNPQFFWGVFFIWLLCKFPFSRLLWLLPSLMHMHIDSH